MKRFCLLGMVLFLLSAEGIQSQESPSRYLDSFARKYSGLKDYRVDVQVHFDIEALQAPDMQARLYYKFPDKTKVESKGIFLFPKEAGYFNPSRFKPDDFEIKLLDHLTYENRNVVRLQLTPKEIKRTNQQFVLTLDIDHSLILNIHTWTGEGREIRATIDYGKFGDFDLPIYIELQMEVPPAEPSGMRDLVPFTQRAQRVSGRVKVKYSNYKVNLGLKDEIFTESESQKLK